ncbi:MAG: DUF4401 domain-containing protein [Pseudomonadota bacterium]
MNDRQTLWQLLHEANLVEGEIPVSETMHSPWYIRAMQGMAGWIGAWFLLGFVGAGLAFVFKSEGMAFVVGLICCAASYWMFRNMSRHGFATQFALAMSLAGQFMVGFGLSALVRHSAESPVFFWLFALFEIALAVVLPNFIHRVLTAYAAVISLSIALLFQNVGHAFPGILTATLALLWLNEFRWAAQGTLVRAIGYGMTLGLIQVDGQLLLGPLSGAWFGRVVEGSWVSPLLGPCLAGAALVWAVFRLLARYNIAPASRTGTAALAITSIVAIAAIKAPGISASLLIILLGFANANRTLLGLGIIALLGYLSYFYYQLDVTLLVKSGALIGIGCMLIAAWYAINTLFSTADNVEKNHA